MGAVSASVKGNYHHQLAAPLLSLNSVELSFLMEVKSDVIKDFGFAKMSELFAIVEVLIKRTFFVFSPFIYLLVGSQGCSLFLPELIVD